MTIFWTFSELHFSGLKSIIFYPEYQKMFFSGKKNARKLLDFFQKKNHALAPLQNVDFFWTFPELHFSGLKTHFFLFKMD